MKCCGVTMSYDVAIDRHHCMTCFGIMSGRAVKEWEENHLLVREKPTGWPLESAAGKDLDDWGVYYRFARNDGDPDDSYRERLIWWVDQKEMDRLYEIGVIEGTKTNLGLSKDILRAVAAMIVASKKGE